METKRICMWSGPRNVSTALMYSFDSRDDCQGVDEPFYAYYLEQTGLEHPARENILAHHETNAQKVIDHLIFGPRQTPYLFVKNMPHHMLDLPLEFVGRMSNFFLIREPKAMIASFIKKIPKPTLSDLGLKRQWEIFEQLQDSGQSPSVIDSADLLKAPERILNALCSQLNIPFDEKMLRWDAGPRDCDGIWAPQWYANVHRSTAFAAPPSSKSDPTLPADLEPLLADCRHYYQKLYTHRIT